MPGEKRVREISEGGMTMRLIDADALDYALGASDEDIYFHHMLEDAPTIDAIPVEWLREWQDEVGTLNEWWPIIERIITVWHEEQEAR